jgi:transglutaminase-like putative cysteine protease
MNRIPWPALLTRRAITLELTLGALACLPLAARQIVPDAGVSLLLPVTLAGALLAWGTVALKLSDAWKRFFLAFLAPLFLALQVGQVTRTLLEFMSRSLMLLPPTLGWGTRPALQDISGWTSALNGLLSQLSLLGQRIGVWLVYAASGAGSEDPTARALVWSLAFWFLAAWAGWQMQRHRRVLMSLVPSTLLLALFLNYYPRQMPLLWIHLAALVLLLGTLSYEKRLSAWRRSSQDYVEAAGLYSLLSTAALTVLLVGSAYFASVTSVREFLDKFREQQRPQVREQADASEPVEGEDGRTSAGYRVDELLGPHRILGGQQLSRDVVMVISTGELPRMPRYANPAVRSYHWRTLTYERYSGRGWTNPSTPLIEAPAGADLVGTPPPGFRLIHQQVRFPSGSTGRLFWSNSLLRADVPIQAVWHGSPPISDEPFLASDLLTAFAGASSYSADSAQLEVKEADLRAAPAGYPGWVRQRYLALPDGVPERVLALARELTSSAASPYDRARAIETYLRKIPYSLEVPAPPPGRDAADYFLFDLKTGYCDYYATAMVVLSRAAGLPARFVTGYASGSYDPETASYIVTGSDAHSWAEIYFPESGWVEFEPTASQPLPYRQGEGSASALGPRGAQPDRSLMPWLKVLNPQIQPSAWLGVLLLLLGVILWEPVKNRLLARYRMEQALSLFYQSLRRSARPLTGPLPPSQTILEYEQALSLKLMEFQARSRFGSLLRPAGEELKRLARSYNASLFAMQSPDRALVLESARAWSRLRWRIRVVRFLGNLKREKQA